MTNALVMQCGGPTPVINASLWGVIRACQKEPAVQRLWGARYALQGLVSGDWADLTDYQDTDEGGAGLEFQSGSALGSARDRLADADISPVLDRLQARGIGFLFLIGGNGSMAVAQKLHARARERGYAVHDLPLRVIGIPKTIDNDIPGTDVCPGYGSAARFVARSVHDTGLDLYAMRGFDDVAVFEVMGRHVGWLAAAAALARGKGAHCPHLILLPEIPLDEEAFLAAVHRHHGREGICMVVTAEGVRDGQGKFLAERHERIERDAAGQKLLSLAGGPAPFLAQMIQQRLGLRCRQMRPDTIQRSSGALASAVDRALAKQVGADAVATAVEGCSGVMIGLERQAKGWRSVAVPLEQVIGRERPLPQEFIAPAAFDVTAGFLDYARSLIGDWSPGARRF